MTNPYDDQNLLESALSQSFSQTAPPTLRDPEVHEHSTSIGDSSSDNLLENALNEAFTHDISPGTDASSTHESYVIEDDSLLEAALGEAFAAASQSVRDTTHLPLYQAIGRSPVVGDDNILETALGTAFSVSESKQSSASASQNEDENLIENALGQAFSTHPSEPVLQLNPSVAGEAVSDDENILEMSLGQAFSHTQNSAPSLLEPQPAINGEENILESSLGQAFTFPSEVQQPPRSENQTPSGSPNILQAALGQAFVAPPTIRPGEIQTSFADADVNSSQNPLETALAEAFYNPPVIRRPEPTELAPHATQTLTPAAQETIESSSADDSWKIEYEALEVSWHAESARARENAVRERERWEAFRRIEKEEAERRKTAEISAQTTSSSSTAVYMSSIPADLNIIQSDKEPSSLLPTQFGTPAGLPRSHSGQDTNEGSQKWEEVQSSLTSSYPSISFEQGDPLSASRAVAVQAPLSATLIIFDSSLSTRTRINALLSSLAINMLLPFVNGVMLGFGEIFAKTFIIQHLGWKIDRPGATATSIGIGINPARIRQAKEEEQQRKLQ